MKRSFFQLIPAAAFVALGIAAPTLQADHGSSHHGSSHSAGHQMSSHTLSSSQFNTVRNGSFNGTITNNLHPINNNLKPIKIDPTFSRGPITSGKISTVPLHTIKPMGGSSGGSSSTPTTNGKIFCPPNGNCHIGCKPCWPPIILGCGPCHGYYGGCYYPPVYTYTETIIVPTSTTVVVTEPKLTTVASVENLPQVPVGSTLTLNGKDLGAKGQTLLMIDKLILGVQIDDWASDHATVTLPMLNISGPTKAEIVLVKADGYAASNVKVELVPAPAKPTSEAVAEVVR